MICTPFATQLSHIALRRRCCQLPTVSVGLLVACTLLTGCSGPAESQASVVDSDDLRINKQPEPGGNAEVVPESTYVSRASLPEHWLEPLNDKDNFFMPPIPTEAAEADETSEVAEIQVRLLGFASVQSTEGAIAKAILKIADHLVYMKVGDVHADLKLVAIDKRSVSLQRGRERWNVVLMNQPITNPDVPYRSNAASRSSSGTGNRTRNPAPSPFPRQNDFPGDPSPGSPGGFHADQQDFNPPAIPDLPEIELPEIDLPEIPGIDLP